jgi:hypothetical protein
MGGWAEVPTVEGLNVAAGAAATENPPGKELGACAD